METVYVFNLKGLDCEHCAEKIRNDTAKLGGVTNADVSVMAQKMTVTASVDEESLLKAVEEIVAAYEPDVKVTPEQIEREEQEEEEDFKKDVIKLAAGGILFGIGFVIGGKAELPLYIIAYIILGAQVVINGVKSIVKGHALDENFLMSLATIGAFAINEPREAVFVMFFYGIGEFFQELAVNRSRKSIKSLMELCPDKASVETAEGIKEVLPETVNTGDIIVIKPGERVPLDCRVISGESEIDYSALTGEAAPVFAEKDSEVLSGSINNTGVLRAEVLRPFNESTVSKILDMVENAASKKTPAENFITTFSKVYTPIVVAAALVLAFAVPLIAGGLFSVWVHRALMFLVVSCPCALVLSVPLAYFAGIGEASRNGILIKGSSTIKALTEADTIVMDKTGTLTEGIFRVEKAYTADGVTEEKLNKAAAEAESMSNHPAAKAAAGYAGKAGGGYVITELSGRGVKAEKNSTVILAGNKRLMDENGITVDDADNGCAVIYIAENGKYLGHYDVSDTIKPDSAEAVKELKAAGKGVYMLTGDNEAAAKKVASALGIEYKASLLPEDKTKFVEKLTSEGRKTVFVGDGINDAPSLMAAYAGIAMGKRGTDSAIEAADCVLMTDEPIKICKAFEIASRTESIVRENIIFSLVIKIAVLVLGAAGLVGMNAAVFADVGVALIAVINSLRKKSA